MNQVCRYAFVLTLMCPYGCTMNQSQSVCSQPPGEGAMPTVFSSHERTWLTKVGDSVQWYSRGRQPIVLTVTVLSSGDPIAVDCVAVQDRPHRRKDRRLAVLERNLFTALGAFLMDEPASERPSSWRHYDGMDGGWWRSWNPCVTIDVIPRGKAPPVLRVHFQTSPVATSLVPYIELEPEGVD